MIDADKNGYITLNEWSYFQESKFFKIQKEKTPNATPEELKTIVENTAKILGVLKNVFMNCRS